MLATMLATLARTLDIHGVSMSYRPLVVLQGSKATSHPYGFIIFRASMSIVLLCSIVSDEDLEKNTTSKRLSLDT
jgi:hypothetical protein